MEAARLHAALGEPRRERRDLRLPARRHREGGRVDRREGEAGAQERRELGLGQRHREHRPGGHLLHQPPAEGDQVERVLEREDAGQAGRDVLADAVAEHGLGAHPPLHPQPGEGVLDGEEGGLREGRPGEARGGLGLLGLLAGGEERLPEIDLEVGQQPLGGAVDLAPEGGLGAVELLPHPGVLGPLAGEEERDRAVDRLLEARQHPPRVERAERRRPLRGIAAHQRAAVGEGAAPHLEGVGDIRQVELGVAVEMVGESRGRRLERRRAGGREDEELARPRRAARGGRRRRGRLLEDGVGVGAADAEGGDARPPRREAGGPRDRPRVDEERAGVEIELRVRPLEVEGGRDLSPLDGERRLDERGYTRRGVEMADVPLDRPQGAGARARRRGEGAV